MSNFRSHMEDFGVFYIISAVIVSLVGVIMFVLIAHNNGIHEGTVTEKGHRAAYSTLMCVGKPIICTTQYHPENWNVTIALEDDTNNFSLTESQWNEVAEGDYLVFEGDTLISQ